MKITKQEQTLYKIIRSIVSGEKKTGDYILNRHYNLMPRQMCVIFKILDDNNIVKRTPNMGYALTENCIENSQRLFMEKIDENFEVIITLAENASIPAEQVIKRLSDRLMKNEDGTE